MLLAWPKLSYLTAVGSWLSKAMVEAAEDIAETILNCDGGMSWHLSATGSEAVLECLKVSSPWSIRAKDNVSPQEIA